MQATEKVKNKKEKMAREDDDMTVSSPSLSDPTFRGPTGKVLTLDEQKEANNPPADAQKPDIQVDPETEKMWQRLNDQANNKSRKNFESMTLQDMWTEAGKEYKYHPVKRSEQAELLELLKEASSLDKQDDFMKYSENIKKRACLVIEGMTADQFEDEEYELMENLTVAWSLKIRGFR